MEAEGHYEQLKRSSLGRIANVGEMYDVRSESSSSFSLFSSSLPSDFIRVTDVNQTEFEYKFTENLSDRSNLMDVEAELQVSVLLGLIKLEGSGKFLNCEKKSGNTISCSLVSKIRTVNEKLFASFEEILQHVDLKLLENSHYTHLITEINWGANCLLNLEFSSGSETQEKNIRGCLAAEFKKVKGFSFSGGGQLNKVFSDVLNGENIDIKVFADVLSESYWPTTVEGFCEFVADVPKMLANVNDGKGKPLNYVMIPLENIRKMANLEIDTDILVRKIDESFLMSTICLFEDIRQMKRKLHDLYQLLSENRNYVLEEDMSRARKMKEGLSLKESELKVLISNDWVLVRKGEKNLKELIKQIEKFKIYNLNLFEFNEFLDSCCPIVNKFSQVKHYISNGIVYLGRGETFHSLHTKYPSHEFIVLITSTEIENANPELNRNTHIYFLLLSQEKKSNTKYVVVDLDLTKDKEFLNNKVEVAKCFHLKGLHVISRDLFTAYVKEMSTNFARPIEGTEVQICDHKPGNRVNLEMVCPGILYGTCPNTDLMWCCYVCKMNIEYGFDENFYCGCGKKPITAFEYRCTNVAHGVGFVVANEVFLESCLSKLRPLKNMNVLVIGQSGVGKSTWINSIINYLTYDSFDDALENGVLCTIPAEMVLYEPKTFKRTIVRIGNVDENEITSTGHSATQYPRTYSFLWKEKCVRIIDTPGLGDTRGIDQDTENLNSIIDHIGYLKELHGVCILLKANDNRGHAIFCYCIKELLAHLHKSVTKNIVFCFTNSRTYTYTPGPASVILENLITNIGIQNELPLGRHNMFSLDNEAFMFLCAIEKQGMQYSDAVKASYSESWNASSEETEKLFDTINTFQPHSLTETLSLVTARNRILSLTKPLVEISKTIQMNIATLERVKKEYEGSEMSIKDLKKNLYFTEIHLEPVALDLPRTVCTSSSCVDYISLRNLDLTEIEYRTHCHTKCYLKNVIPKIRNNAELRYCDAMVSGKCKVCGCGWEMHMHLTYSQKRVEKVHVNESVKTDMKTEEQRKTELQNYLTKLETKVQKYKAEQEVIIQTSVKFGMFLKENAIAPYNDSVADYLTYLIDEEQKKPYKTETEKNILENLKMTMERYNKQVSILQNVLEQTNDKSGIPTASDVNKLEEALYGLELSGSSIKKCAEESRRSSERARQYFETPVHFNSDFKYSRGEGARSDMAQEKGKKKKPWYLFYKNN